MTGLLGGGHAIYYDAKSERAANLDCFVAMPGLGRERREVALLELEVPFGDGARPLRGRDRLVRRPGVPAGLDALWSEHGRLPWPRLVEPALRLARRRRADARGPRLLPGDARAGDDDERGRGDLLAGRIAARGGRPPPAAGARPRARDRLPTRAREAVYEGTIGKALLELMEERGGLVTAEDLEAYEATWSEPVERRVPRLRHPDPGGALRLPRSPRRAYPALRALGARSVRSRSSTTLLEEPRPRTGTTNLSVIDDDGNACVLTTSLGLGSGDFLPGLDLHLNSMLGEADLLTGPLEPGERMASMMAPSLALDAEGWRSRPAQQAARACGARCSRSSPASSTRGSTPRPPSTGRGFTRPDRSCTSSPASSRRRSVRSSRPASRCGRGPDATTTSAA